MRAALVGNDQPEHLFALKFYVRENGARGYFAVNPEWTRVIGDGDPAKLFHVQTNMRFGTVIVRHYLDENNGGLNVALAQYLANSWQIPATDVRIARGVAAIFEAQRRWIDVDEASSTSAT